MALRELVTQLRYELKDGNLKKYVDGYRNAEKQINTVAKAASQKLNGALRDSTRNMGEMNRTGGRLTGMMRGLVRETREFAIGLRQGARQGYGEVLRQMDRVEAKQRRLRRTGAGGAGERMGFGGGVLQGAIQGILATITGKAFMDASDSWSTTKGQLALQNEDPVDRARSRDYLFSRAQQQGQDYGTSVGTYTRIARNRQVLGLSNDQVLQMTGTLGGMLALGGGSASSQQAALEQFGQAMSSGVLRGEELNSVLEQAPVLANAIAKSFGITSDQLRNIAQEGKLTSKGIAKGLLGQAEEIDAAMASLPMTFQRSFTQIRNQFTRLAGELNEKYQLAEKFNVAAQWVMKNMAAIGAALAAIAGSWAAVRVFTALSGIFRALQAVGRPLLLFFDRLARGNIAQAFSKFGSAGLRVLKVLRGIGVAISTVGALGLGVFAAIAAVVVAAGLLIYKYWAPIKAFLIGFWQGFSESASQAFDELAVALRPLGPYVAAVVGWLKEMWTWFLNLIAPVNATQEELDQATASGRKFGQAMVANLRMVIAVIGLLVRGIVVVGQVMGAVTGVIGAAWDAIIGRFRSGWAALTAAIPGWALNGVGIMGQLANGGSLASVAASSMVSAGRGSQSVSNTTSAVVHVTPPPGGSPAAYGAAAQRGTSKALSSFQYQLPTAVEAF